MVTLPCELTTDKTPSAIAMVTVAVTASQAAECQIRAAIS